VRLVREHLGRIRFARRVILSPGRGRLIALLTDWNETLIVASSNHSHVVPVTPLKMKMELHWNRFEAEEPDSCARSVSALKETLMRSPDEVKIA
jgi:hypothetical protein